MPTDTMFQPLPGATAAPTVEIQFNDGRLSVPAGISVAAALLQAGVQRFRASPVSGAPRAPYCMMGVCFECLVEIDGEPSRQACLVLTREGMKVRSQEGARSFDSPAAASGRQEVGHDA